MTEQTEIEVIFIGKRRLANNKVGLSFITPAQFEDHCALYAKQREDGGFPHLDQDWTIRLERQASLFDGKGANIHSIGGIYKTLGEIEADRVKTMVITKLQWKREVEVGFGFVAAWKQLSRSVEEEKRREGLEKKADADPAMTKAMDVLRERFRKIPAGYRRAFQLWLMDELEKRK